MFTDNLIDNAIPLKKRKANDPELQTLPMPPTDQVEGEEEGYRQLSIRSAELALDYFNKDNNTKYVLVIDQPLAGNNFVDHRGFWTHCCFYAKDSSMKQFFAEIRTFHLSEPAVICMILEGQTRRGCYYCSWFIHPIDGFEYGCLKDSNASSVSDSDEDTLMDRNLNVGLVEKVKDSENKTPDSPAHQPDSPPYQRAYWPFYVPLSPPYHQTSPGRRHSRT